MLSKHGRVAIVLVATPSVACMPGGGVSGQVMTDTGVPASHARVDIDFRDGTSFNTLPDESGRYMTAWSHGSWKGVLIRASAPGRQSVQAVLGWDGWTCDFSLAPEGAPPATSKVTC